MEENTLAAISVVVEEPDSVPALNALLHEYAGCIIGRMGIPYRQRGVSFICLALGRLRGVTARAAYSSAGGKKKETRVKNDE